MADATEMNNSEIITNKLKVNNEKYPIEKCKGSSKKYNELED